ncbi:hypothetical protein L1275_001486 [Flavobacterium sp. HSC-61S13]|nr:hypothetical protein [Flavobacterium sp. HSC-61S13]
MSLVFYLFDFRKSIFDKNDTSFFIIISPLRGYTKTTKQFSQSCHPDEVVRKRNIIYNYVTPMGLYETTHHLQLCHPYGVVRNNTSIYTIMSPLRGYTKQHIIYNYVTPAGLYETTHQFIQLCHPYGVA